MTALLKPNVHSKCRLINNIEKILTIFTCFLAKSIVHSKYIIELLYQSFGCDQVKILDISYSKKFNNLSIHSVLPKSESETVIDETFSIPMVKIYSWFIVKYDLKSFPGTVTTLNFFLTFCSHILRIVL